MVALTQFTVYQQYLYSYSTQVSAKMHRLKTNVKTDEGVSRLDRIRNTILRSRLNQEGSLKYVRRRQQNRKHRLEEMSSRSVTKFMMVRFQGNFCKDLSG